ncbi:MAG TPA: DUF4126 domain-containing protein [Candidatus Polarisedimenticolia bacterium]|nr:DUF4126 domain-containing protein [Candidatus Polarisedimenticolia bacterium]
MSSVETLTLGAAIATGLTLAACAGLRAFLPVLALAVAARAGLIPLAGELQWLASNTALIVLSSAVFFEVLGDKIPAVDHALDAVGMVIRPIAGGLAAVVPFAAALPGLTGAQPQAGDWGAGSWAVLSAGALAGGGLSAAVHLAKSSLRVGSTGLTFGIANPVLSLVEDGVGLAGVLLAILLPLLALAGLAAAAAVAVIVLAARRQASPRRA